MGSITNQKFSQASSAERKKTRQKQYRRTKTLMKKAFEVSRSCEADVFFGVRMKNSGHIYTFCADSTGIWSFISSQLVWTLLLLLYDLELTQIRNRITRSRIKECLKILQRHKRSLPDVAQTEVISITALRIKRIYRSEDWAMAWCTISEIDAEILSSTNEDAYIVT